MKYIVGIDQSLTSTGVVIIEHEKKIIKSSKIFKADAMEPLRYEPTKTLSTGENHWQIQERRITTLIDEIIKWINQEIGHEYEIVTMESLGASTSNAPNVLYVLGYLFFRLVEVFTEYDKQIISINSQHWKKGFYHMTTVKEKEQLHEHFWDDAFLDTGYESDIALNGPSDLKDAFILAYMASIYSNLGVKKFHEAPNPKMAEAFKSIYCMNVKLAKLCWYCPWYDKVDTIEYKNGRTKKIPLCLKPKEKTKKRKKDEEFFQECQRTPIQFF